MYVSFHVQNKSCKVQKLFTDVRCVVPVLKVDFFVFTPAALFLPMPERHQ